MKAIGTKIIQWYQQNKRDLPWRETQDPYRIWLSEIILQQTRVDQGMSYYLRFLELFPDVRKMAAATEDQVLKAWQGLGYYSRARNLHFTAKEIVQRYKGKFPEKADELLKLKGIGPYTAAAIASFCFGESRAAVDGNVIRVLSRLFTIPHPSDTPAGKREVEKIAAEMIRPQDPAQFNQAMM